MIDLLISLLNENKNVSDYEIKKINKNAHKLLRNTQAEQHTNCHDPHDQGKSKTVNLFYPLFFPCAIVITDQRTDSLDDTVCRQIQEGLQLVIDAKHQHVSL